MEHDSKTGANDRLLRFLKNLAYVFCGVTVLNLFLQAFNYIANYPASVELINIIAVSLGPVITSFFFLGFVVFVDLVRGGPDEDE
jgi:hypothetical protein